MNENLGSFKLLENVHLKATQNIEVNGKIYEEGETIALFDSIQVAGLEEFRSYVAARGGYDNRGLVYWETARDMRLTFSQGVFSNTQFGLLNNSKMISYGEDEPLLVTYSEELESDEVGLIETKYEPIDKIFVYDKTTGNKINWLKANKGLQIEDAFLDVVVTYMYNYMGGVSVAKIGQPFLKGFLELEGKTRVKDDTSGLITTGIIRIPKLKLMSGLSIKIGAQASPAVGNFTAVGVPVGSRSDSYIAEFCFLNSDIDSDM